MRADMKVKPSDRTLQIATMFQLSTEDVNMARLLATEASDIEAYLLTHEIESGLNMDAMKMRCSRYLKDHPKVKDCEEWFNTGRIKADSSIFDSQETREKKRKKGDSKMGVYSKDDALASVNKLIVEGRLTDKEKLAAIDLLNKLQQWNKEENKDEVELVHFYLPITCKRCSLYMKEKELKSR